jgi:alpha-tubulin suppressor-like RCC1 family protein
MLLGCGRIGFGVLGGSDDTGDGGLGDANSSGFTHLVAYADQTCALFAGQPYCWGRNDLGQLGDGTMAAHSVPTKVKVPEGAIADLELGETHGCAIVSGAVYCWGEGFAASPAAVTLPDTAIDLALGHAFTCVLTQANKTLCFGDNNVGQLGDGSFAPHATPMPISGTALFTQLDGGDDHVCGAIANETAMCWGHNDDGTLGTGSMNPAASNVAVTVIGNAEGLPRIAGWHACSLEDGKVSCWGRNTEGELGNNSNASTATPQPVPGLTGITAIATGGGPTDHDASCAVDAAGSVVCWGGGLEGRLGNGLTTDSKVPVGVLGLPGPASSVAIGIDHACALLVDSDIWCWGKGDSGQLGNGLKVSSLTPVRVTPPPS